MVGCCFVTVLLFLPCVCCEDVAIVISGGPDWRNVSFHLNGTLSFYRMVADGARMANDLEANGYKVNGFLNPIQFINLLISTIVPWIICLVEQIYHKFSMKLRLGITKN